MRGAWMWRIALASAGLMACADDLAPADDDAGAPPADAGQVTVPDAGPEPEPDAGPHDAGGDAATDAGPSEGEDAMVDDDAAVPVDAGSDAGGCGTSTPADCAGVCGGSATLDCAGTCNGSATLDCAGTCNGSATLDCTGTCNGSATLDCAGTCNGSATLDCAGTCNGSATLDCAGVCNGSATPDCAGVCNGSATLDCAGACNGSATLDCTGACNGGATCAVPGAGDLVVSEVMFNPATVDDTLGEWFELYNTTTSHLDLQGCTIADGSSGPVPIDIALRVAPGGYATFARSANPGFTPSFVYGNAIQLSNTSDQLYVHCNATEIEHFAYNVSSYAAAAGVSLSITPIALNSASNETPANWCGASASYNGDLGTPGTANPLCMRDASVAGDIVINELMVNPFTLTDMNGEWFELHNPGTIAINIGGCTLKDDGADSLEIASTLVLPPGGFVTFASSAAPGFTPDVSYTSTELQLGNAGDELELVCNATSIDRVAYDNSTWTIPNGASFSLDPAAADAALNDAVGAWCPGTSSYNGDFGSPGQANPACL